MYDFIQQLRRITMKSTVYFTRDLSPEAVLRIYDALDITLEGKVAVKVHSGEPGNQNFLRPDFWKPMIDKVGGAIVECNTAYDGGRNTTRAHKITMEKHGWVNAAQVDILDETDDMELAIPGGKVIQKNFVGAHLADYNSLLVLSHFKGHPMGGFGGALKNISIGIASSRGKQYIHGAGDMDKFWDSDHDSFLESMADAAWSIHHRFQGKIAYINVMKNMSVDCDCCAVAADPKIGDIGILASLDPVALDQACLDLVYQSDDPGKGDLIERIESLHGVHTVEAAAGLGVGSREYNLVELS